MCPRPAGPKRAIRETLERPVDLVLIDATNVGLEKGALFCEIVKRLRPSETVALLVLPETSISSETMADRIILRAGPRSFLVEVDEILGGRLDIDLWRGERQDADENRMA